MSKLLIRVLAVLIGLIGLICLVGGGWLLSLHGSPNYLIVGIVYLLAAIQLWRLRKSGAWLVGLVALLTVLWVIWVHGFIVWAWFLRVMIPMVLAAFAMLLATPLATRGKKRGAQICGGVVAAVVTVAILGHVFIPHGTAISTPHNAYQKVGGDNQPSTWSAYGGSLAGKRYSTADQINRANVARLEVAWIYRTGETGKGFPGDAWTDHMTFEATPILYDGTLYLTTSETDVVAIDA
ncbi:MAG: membrane-bound PQQ-dependent dehydrogenase, glucose/quinate/shikimate family, partial [Gammaproteobacteria bacterium]|nr:membrane-bound PQQ-dependent dehydrogenase, glucose/quinate/shikimate family [Gammaproteobacteria bacterium]